MTREQLKTGFRSLLQRVFDVDAFFDRVFEDHSRRVSSQAVRPPATRNFRQSLLISTGWTARAIMLAFVMASHGQLIHHLRACLRVLRRNATLGPNAFSFSDLVGLWITYWHFASVTRQISGTQFGNVPADSPC